MTPTEQDNDLQFCESCSCMTRGNPTCGKCGAWRETETMTPTEQDKELQSKSYKLAQEYLSTDSLEGFVDLIQNNLTLDEALQLITADRKRVALEAELQLLTYLLDERTERMFMQTPYTGEMTDNRHWACNTSLTAVDAYRIEAERRKRIAELKAQQEEV